MKCLKGFIFGVSCDKQDECFSCNHVVWVACYSKQQQTCDTCGGTKQRRAKDGRCYDCGKWFAHIKTELFHSNKKMWYKIRAKGGL